MSDILLEFRKRRELLENLRANEDKQRLTTLLNWMEAQPEINRFSDDLRSKVDPKTLIPKRSGFPRPPNTNSPLEVQAFGLFLMEECRRGHSLHVSGHAYNVKPAGASRAQHYIDEAVVKYVNPFLDSVVQELQAPSDTTASATFDRLAHKSPVPSVPMRESLQKETVTLSEPRCQSEYSGAAWRNQNGASSDTFRRL